MFFLWGQSKISLKHIFNPKTHTAKEKKSDFENQESTNCKLGNILLGELIAILLL